MIVMQIRNTDPEPPTQQALDVLAWKKHHLNALAVDDRGDATEELQPMASGRGTYTVRYGQLDRGRLTIITGLVEFPARPEVGTTVPGQHRGHPVSVTFTVA